MVYHEKVTLDQTILNYLENHFSISKTIETWVFHPHQILGGLMDWSVEPIALTAVRFSSSVVAKDDHFRQGNHRVQPLTDLIGAPQLLITPCFHTGWVFCPQSIPKPCFQSIEMALNRARTRQLAGAYLLKGAMRWLKKATQQTGWRGWSANPVIIAQFLYNCSELLVISCYV